MPELLICPQQLPVYLFMIFCPDFFFPLFPFLQGETGGGLLSASLCYKDEIDRQATVKKRQPDGTFKLEIDEDMRQYITMKLIEALPQFPLEEMEREEKRNRDKKS